MIRARGLTRTFRDKDRVVEAVRGIDLDVWVCSSDSSWRTRDVGSDMFRGSHGSRPGSVRIPPYGRCIDGDGSTRMSGVGASARTFRDEDRAGPAVGGSVAAGTGP